MLPTDKPKIGEGSLKAMARMGHKELAQILPAFNNGIQIVEEPGMVSNPTSYEVSRQTGVVDRSRGSVHGNEKDSGKDNVQDKGSVHGKQPEKELEPEYEP